MTAEISGSPRPIVIEGKEYYASPLTDGDIVELDHWLQANSIARVRESLIHQYGDFSKIPDDVYRREMELAHRNANELTWMSGQGAKMMATVDGVSRVLWHQLRHRHPELTHEDVRKMCFSKETIETAQQVFEQLNIDPMVDKTRDAETEGASRKKRAPQQRKGEKRRQRKNKST